MTEKPALIKPEEITLPDPDKEGGVLKYVISRFDAVTGRRIGCMYPVTALPKLGDYDQNEKMFFLMMTFVERITPEGHHVRLETPELYRNHVPEWETGIAIEKAMMFKNTSFFRDGRALTFLDGLLEMILKKGIEMLTLSSAPSSAAGSPPSTNSEQSMT